MHLNKLKVAVFTVCIGAVTPVLASSLIAQKPKFEDIEKQAMSSLGYGVIAKVNSYPNDKYAMPEPYSFEPLVIYAYKGKDKNLNVQPEDE